MLYWVRINNRWVRINNGWVRINNFWSRINNFWSLIVECPTESYCLSSIVF